MLLNIHHVFSTLLWSSCLVILFDLICVIGFVYQACSLVGPALSKGLIWNYYKKGFVSDFTWIHPVEMGLFLHAILSVSLLFIGMKLLFNSLHTACDFSKYNINKYLWFYQEHFLRKCMEMHLLLGILSQCPHVTWGTSPYSEGPLIRRFYSPTFLWSEGSIVRGFYTTKVL